MINDTTTLNLSKVSFRGKNKTTTESPNKKTKELDGDDIIKQQNRKIALSLLSLSILGTVGLVASLKHKKNKTVKEYFSMSELNFPKYNKSKLTTLKSTNEPFTGTLRINTQTHKSEIRYSKGKLVSADMTMPQTRHYVYHTAEDGSVIGCTLNGKYTDYSKRAEQRRIISSQLSAMKTEYNKSRVHLLDLQTKKSEAKSAQDIQSIEEQIQQSKIDVLEKELEILKLKSSVYDAPIISKRIDEANCEIAELKNKK